MTEKKRKQLERSVREVWPKTERHLREIVMGLPIAGYPDKVCCLFTPRQLVRDGDYERTYQFITMCQVKGVRIQVTIRMTPTVEG